ncbi:MAG TPA: carboxypeptidase regulatory-like domain-containing protein [Vicinamibacterales bacterium]|nr:carboxypeptidase regulatory-like domain-containing protein [Vicinamibacterales bacterium]
MRRRGSSVIAYLLTTALVAGSLPVPVRAAAEYVGQVSFAGIAVPGAQVTATHGETQLATTTDAQGVFRIANIADGAWTFRVEMRGFSTLSRDVTIGPDAQPMMWELSLLPFEEITRGLPPPAPRPAPAPESSSQSSSARSQSKPPRPATPQTGFQRAGVAPPQTPPSRPAAAAPADDPPADSAAAADGFLINGSVNNGAASPFAQPAAFGNNRRRPGALYNGMIGSLFSNSAWDARPYPLTGIQTPRPDYYNVHLLGTFGGPVKLPRLQNRLNVFVGFQRLADDNALTQPGLMPTPLERSGNFSQSRDASGRPVQIIDPLTGLPFPGNTIPHDRISPQASSLLGYYPQPTRESNDRYNYEVPILSVMRQDSLQSRLTQNINQRNQVFGNVSYQRTTSNANNLFGFEDENGSSAVDAQVNWTHRIAQLVSMRLRYQFARQTNETTPYFAYRNNVSGDAGINGNNQEPVNWGPPSLSFASGISGLNDGLPRFTRNQTNAVGGDSFMSRGRHNFTIGGDLKRNQVDILAQQDPRGGFAFTGALTGSDLADFLLGVPATSQIAYGNADKYLRGFAYDAYVTDDWRVGPSLTVTAGVRWEYESPLSERYDRLVNLDIGPGFTSISPIVASEPTGSLTGETLPSALMQSDWGGLQPRLAVAWRPVPGSSVVVRAGYGIYRNTNVYQSIATLMAQQPPLSRALSIANSIANPLTLANGFVAPEGATLNTFAVDPDFRIGSAHNWQVSIQRDLPASLTVNATYLGTRGNGLIQEFLPNTYPPGFTDPCPTCPSGFVYLLSNGTSSRHAGQLQVRRRLRNGLTATVQYTLAKAIDDAASYAGANLSSSAFAQNWLDLEAERGPSSFDQRHLLSVQFQYTTGVGVAGGALVDGWQGSLLKGWTISSQLTAGSAMPVTPYYLTTTPGTGFTGAIRASLTAASTDAPDGYYLNPAAYTTPAPGEWGDSGRNSARGAPQFGVNAGITRTFPWGSRLNMDFRIDATNVLNSVTYSSVNALVGSPQFGLPSQANQMRRVQTSLRMRF